MNPITHECRQGTQEWLDLRTKYFTASELSAAAGESKYQKRSDLLKQKATGIIPEVDAAKQRLFDAGHAAEAAARQIVESIIGVKLFPVTMSDEVDGLPLLASLDGITMFGDIIWENKLLNESLKADVLNGQIDNHYALQIEQQLLVSGAEKCYFTTSDGTPDGTFGMWYESNHELRCKVVSTWKQFAADLANYQPEEIKSAPVAEKIEGLPALFVQVEGRVVASNMDAFKAAAEAFMARLPKADQLQTDQDFANADLAAKDCKDAEEKLQVVKAQAQSQAVSIDEAFRAIDSISEKIRAARLSLEKVVKAEKENRKAEIVREGQLAFSEHMQGISDRLRLDGVMKHFAMPQLGEAVKGLKSLDSMRDKVSSALANAKIEANAIADRIEANRKTVEDMSLFPDFAQVCTKAPEDFAALLAMRVNQRKEAESKRLEAERERIRAEEQAKAQREADAKIATERAEASRIAAEAKAKEEAERKAAALAEAEKLAAEQAVVKDSLTTENHIEQPIEKVESGATIKLGEICSRLGFTITAEFLASLGYRPVATDKNAKLYAESQWRGICSALVQHISNVAVGMKKAA